MTGDDILKRFRRIVLELFPELGGTHLPLKGEVTKVYGDAGSVRVSNGARRYSVDIKPLHPDGTEDKSRPRLKDVPLDVPWAGDKRGVFALPKVGAIVRVGFYGGSSAHPYIDGILADGSSVPQVEQGQYLIQLNDQMNLLLDKEGLTIQLKDAGAELDIDVMGDATIKTSAKALIDALTDATVKAEINASLEAGVKAKVQAPFVDIGAAATLGIAYQTGLVTTPFGPGVITLGSVTCKVTP